jgi:hypothetical protein
LQSIEGKDLSKTLYKIERIKARRKNKKRSRGHKKRNNHSSISFEKEWKKEVRSFEAQTKKDGSKMEV